MTAVLPAGIRERIGRRLHRLYGRDAVDGCLERVEVVVDRRPVLPRPPRWIKNKPRRELLRAVIPSIYLSIYLSIYIYIYIC